MDRRHALVVHYNFLNGVKFKIDEMKARHHWLVPSGGIESVLAEMRIQREELKRRGEGGAA